MLILDCDIPKAVVFYQQDLACTATLTNKGPGEIFLNIPSQDRTQPTVHLLETKTGAERICQREMPPMATIMEPGRLPAGESLEIPFRLLEITGYLEPGEYEIRLDWKYNRGTAVAHSPPKPLRVLPTTPKSLRFVDGVGGQGVTKFGAWVNLTGDPPQVMVSRFVLRPGLPVDDVQNLGDCRALTQPVIAAPALGQILKGHWIAWTDEKNLYYAHADPVLGVSNVHSMTLPAAEAQVLSPLQNDPVTDTTVRPNGSLLMGLESGTQFVLQTVSLTSGRAAFGPNARIAGPKPDWIVSHFRSDGRRLTTYVRTENGKVLLYSMPWPGTEARAPQRLGEWPGSLLGAGAGIWGVNTISGGLLIRKSSQGAFSLVLICWSLSTENEFKLTGEHDIGWDGNVPIRQACIRISSAGRVVALLCDGLGKWHVYIPGEGMKPVPPPFDHTLQPIDIAFLEGVGEPILICGTLTRGFVVIRLDGSPIPPDASKD